tara:strand:+ start:942 stop:1247 length:306 start_codon:yes stop_codon:yes gene_type:complete
MRTEISIKTKNDDWGDPSCICMMYKISDSGDVHKFSDMRVLGEEEKEEVSSMSDSDIEAKYLAIAESTYTDEQLNNILKSSKLTLAELEARDIEEANKPTE